MAGTTILLVTNLDTRGAAFAHVRDLVVSQGAGVILMDISMEMSPPFPGDITCDAVAEAAGSTIDQVRQAYRTQRKTATDCMIRGGRRLARDLFDRGRIHGVLGVGGATATLVATSIMKALPFGLPKVMASSVGSHPGYVSRYIGTKDIMMLNTVVDVMGANTLLWRQMRNAVGAACGAAALYADERRSEGAPAGGPEAVPRRESPVIGITSFGFAERCVERVVGTLKERGFEPVPFHAQGQGDRAMDELIRDGMLDGVVDVVTRGIGEEALGGNCAAGLDRIAAAAQGGLPQVLAPSGLDMLSVGGQPDWRTRFAGRPYAVIDELRVEVRTSAEECRAFARIVADRLQGASAPFRFLIPRRGWSSLDREDGPLWDPEADAAFVQGLRAELADPDVVIEVDANLYSAEFADACSATFLEIWAEHQERHGEGAR